MITKLVVFVLMMAIVFVIMEAGRFVVAYKAASNFETTPKRTTLTIIAIAYILTIIFTGIHF